MRYLTRPLILIGFFLALASQGCLSEINDARNATPTPKEALSRPLGTVKMETDKSQYAITDSVELVVSNTSTAKIIIPFPQNSEVGEQTFRFYKKTLMGWRRLYPIPGLLVAPVVNAPGLVIPSGSKSEISISPYLDTYDIDRNYASPLIGTFMVQTRYSRNDLGGTDELVQYSNAFQIGEAESIDVTGVTVNVTQTRSLVFSLQNNSNMPIWVPNRCSQAELQYGHSAFSDDGLLSLQRLTDETTWQIIRTTKTDCVNAIEPPQVVLPGQAITIHGTQWFQAKLADLPAGIYRWDVVFYLEYDQVYKDYILRDVRHIFSETFEYSP